MGTQTVTETEFNVLQFEKQLTSLKDSQDSINTCCQWCLQNRAHHKKIVNAWLNVLKRVKVEQRLILFYLANDVVQYSKRRNYEYVESWGTALQKATTMVRDEKVKHKILRIFKIWEQRGVYNEEFISDLCGLLSVVPSGSKGDEPHEFQPNYVVNKIKVCSNLEKDTDYKLKLLKEHNPKIVIDDGLIVSLKDRAHVDDVEKELEVFVIHMEDYINALKLEIKNRIALITVLKQAESQLEADRKDVKIVANAYKMFGTRVKTFQKKLDEHKATLTSPIPSPDVNAPSPSPDSDIELPEEEIPSNNTPKEGNDLQVSVSIADYNPINDSLYTNAGYYNPVPPPDANSATTFLNGFTNFMGTDLTSAIEKLSSSSNVMNNTAGTVDSDNLTISTPAVQNPPLPVQAPTIVTSNSSSTYSYNTSDHLPLLPPPMPPFSKSEVDYGNTGYNTLYTTTTSSTTHYEATYSSAMSYNIAPSTYNTSPENTNITTFMDESFEPPLGANPYPPSEEYNPEEDVSTWEPDALWNEPQQLEISDTPESPPLFEKEGYSDPVEYHDTVMPTGAIDIDHRILPGVTIDLEDSLSSLGGKDVDHRNLISLTGSPGNSNSNNLCENNMWNPSQTDQDYRTTSAVSTMVGDQDYRLTGFNIEQLKLPPPPPPPPKLPENVRSRSFLSPPPKIETIQPLTSRAPSKSRRSDNVESIDMDLSDDDLENKLLQKYNDNLKVVVDHSSGQQFSLEPPPPLPDLPDDVDANNFLDDLSNELHEFTNLSDELSNPEPIPIQNPNMWSQPLLPPPTMDFDVSNSINMPLINHPPINSPHMIPPPINPGLHPPPSPLNNVMNPPPFPPVSLASQSNHWGQKEEPWTNDETWKQHNELWNQNEQRWLNESSSIDESSPNWEQDSNHLAWMPERQNSWQGQPQGSFPFRGGRGNIRGGNFSNNYKRGIRGRGGMNFGMRGVSNFWGRGLVPRGGSRPPRQRGNFRGSFKGGF